VPVAKGLLRHCRILYVMTPYREMKDGRPLRPDGGDYHQVTLDEHSFDSVGIVGIKIIRTPGAWTYPLREELLFHFRNLLHGEFKHPPLEIIYTVTNIRNGEKSE
jgi:hypothetical protein